MCTYLDQVRSTYYFRRVVPAELRPFLRTVTGKPRAEFKISLGTKDRGEAKRRLPQHVLESDRLFDEARARLLDSSPDAAPPKAITRGLSEFDLEQMGLRTADNNEREARREGRRHHRQQIEARLGMSTERLSPREAAHRDILRERDEELRTAQDHLIAHKVMLAEARAVASPTAPAEDAHSVIAAPDGEGEAIMLDARLVDLWAAERKVARKGIDTHRAVARWFYERVGRKPVGQITRKDVLTFKAKLVEQAQSPANIKMKLSRLRTLLNWAAENDYAETNVALGITIKDTDAAKNKRKEFDLSALKAIFFSPVYSDGARPAGGKGEAAYWLPILALFTGARLEELGQLRPADVTAEGYPDADGAEQHGWFIRITEDDADDLKIKNAVSERRVPLHPELERLGFIRFVEAAKVAGQPRLFPKLKPNIYDILTAKWGEWFSGYLRGICGVTDKRMVFHSFRHTFKHYARHSGMIEGVQRQIMGHSSGDVADDYGSGYSLYQLVEGMKLYRVPGLKLPA